MKETKRDIVLTTIRDIGGATADEVEDLTGIPHQTASSAISRAKTLGLVRDSGQTRPTRHGGVAVVWEWVSA